ncbi:MAG: hypothetical protein Q8K30_04995 [Candidatus Gracilibacteria bacterium]|nr:hypothetical protein [Candidatus Gracilibacteria bacterium]
MNSILKLIVVLTLIFTHYTATTYAEYEVKSIEEINFNYIIQNTI